MGKLFKWLWGTCVAAEAGMANQTKREPLGTAEQRIHRSDRPSGELADEVAQRGGESDAHATQSDKKSPPAPGKKQTSGYGNREDRENPAMGLPQSGERQSHDLPGEGIRVGSDEHRAMSQNGARISDFEERPSR